MIKSIINIFFVFISLSIQPIYANGCVEEGCFEKCVGCCRNTANINENVDKKHVVNLCANELAVPLSQSEIVSISSKSKAPAVAYNLLTTLDQGTTLRELCKKKKTKEDSCLDSCSKLKECNVDSKK